MGDELSIKIKTAIDTVNSVQSISELKKGMKDLQNLTQQVGEGSSEFNKLSQAIANGKDKIEDLNDSVKSLKGTGVEKLTGSLNLLREGFANVDPQKIGIGFKAMGAAMAAIPIFLLIEGLKLLWDNLDKVTGFLNGSTKELKAAQSQFEATTMAANNYSKELQRQVDLLTAQGGSEKDILKLKKEVLAQDLLAAEATYKLNAVKLLQVQSNDSIWESMMRLYAMGQKLIGNTIAAEGAELEIANNKKERAAEFIKLQDDAENAIKDIVTKSQVAQAEVVTKSNEKQKASYEEKNKAILDSQKKLEDDLAKQAIANRDKNDTDELKNTTDLIAQVGKLKDDEELRLAASDEIRLQIKRDREFAVLEKEFADSNRSVEAYQALQDGKILIENNYYDDSNNLRLADETKQDAADKIALDKAKKLAEDKHKAELDVATRTTAGLQGLSDLYFAVKIANTQKGSAEELKAAKAQFKINKTLAMTGAVITGVQTVMAAFASGMATPIIGPATGAVFAVLAGITAAANIAKIAGTQFEGGGSVTASTPTSSVSTVNTPTVNTPTANTPTTNPVNPDFSVFGNNNANNVGSNQNITVRSIVVAQEITDNQTQNNYSNSLGTL